MVELLVPELQRRGRVWDEYPQAPRQAAQSNGLHGFGDGEDVGLTAREKLYGVGQKRLRDDHYGSTFRWKAGQEPPKLS